MVVVDIATPYKDTEPLTSKESYLVEKAFEKIYSRKLNWLSVLMVDPGKEFFGSVNTLMKKHAVKFQRSEAGTHRAQSFVERANRTLSEILFSHQYAQEMITKGGSVEWVKRLPFVLKAIVVDRRIYTRIFQFPLRINVKISEHAPNFNVFKPRLVCGRILILPSDSSGKKIQIFQHLTDTANLVIGLKFRKNLKFYVLKKFYKNYLNFFVL